eukprot:1155672-Pelagomonas_calceolata.AAC.5
MHRHSRHPPTLQEESKDAQAEQASISITEDIIRCTGRAGTLHQCRRYWRMVGTLALRHRLA